MALTEDFLWFVHVMWTMGTCATLVYSIASSITDVCVAEWHEKQRFVTGLRCASLVNGVVFWALLGWWMTVQDVRGWKAFRAQKTATSVAAAVV